MQVFLSGATGALGRPTTRALLAAGHRVRGVARGPAKAELVRADGGEPVELSLFDTRALRAAMEGCDAVMHFATKIPPPGRITRRKAAENDRLRRDASRCLVDAALATGIRSYVQESICFLYGDGGDAWLDEEAPFHQSWLNDSTHDAERETARFARGAGRGVSLRFGAFYAPYARSTLDTARLARRGLLPVLGTGAQFLSSIHVDDAASAAVAALGVDSGVYNVVDDEPLRFREYVEVVGASLGVTQRLRLPVWLAKAAFGEASHVFLVSRRVSNRRFRTAAAWSPRATSARKELPAVLREIIGDQGDGKPRTLPSV
jgi:nucleoside-diphosphate-sugar epimerase